MDALTRKKISRTQLRNHCKKLEGQLDGLLENFPADGLKKLKALKANYESQIGKIATANNDIAELLDTQDDLEKDMSDALVLDDIHYEFLAKVDEKLQEKSAPDVKPDVSKPESSGSVGDHHVKTPKLDLKSFDGDVLKWQSWWDQYEAAVHNQPKMANVNKFCHLQRLLGTSAEECIAGLALTNENYPEAIKLLKDRYGNKQVLINVYVQNFEGLRRVTTMNKVKDLRSLHDAVVSTIRNLEVLNVEADTYGSFLVPILSKKLPEELRMFMSREFKNDVWSIDAMMKIFKDELEAKERCTMSLPSSKEDFDDENPYSTSNLHSQQRSSKDNGGRKGDRGGAKKRSCAFCGVQEHSAAQCNNVTDLNARLVALKKANRCFVCLLQGHKSRNCMKKIQCKKCGKRHHVSVCDSNPDSLQLVPVQGGQLNDQQDLQYEATQGNQVQVQYPGFGFAQYPNVSQYPNFPQSSNFQNPYYRPTVPQNFATTTQRQVRFDPNVNVSVIPPNTATNMSVSTTPILSAPDGSSAIQRFQNLVAGGGIMSQTGNSSSVTSCSINSEESVLLLTGRAMVSNTYDSNTSCNTRVLFDDCSQRTYVTKSVRKKLQLPTLRNDRISVN